MISIYETNKMKVEIRDEKVIKIFKDYPSSTKRFLKEKEALKRLSGVSGFPQLISTENKKIVMTRLGGENKAQLSDQALLNLRKLVMRMLEVGVARHALPERDLLIDGDRVSMVDFERVTLRSFEWSPLWIAAKKVTIFNLLRFISNHNPDLLSADEKKKLHSLTIARARLQKLKKIRSIRKMWSSKPEYKSHYTTKFKRDNLEGELKGSQ